MEFLSEVWIRIDAEKSLFVANLSNFISNDWEYSNLLMVKISRILHNFPFKNCFIHLWIKVDTDVCISTIHHIKLWLWILILNMLCIAVCNVMGGHPSVELQMDGHMIECHIPNSHEDTQRTFKAMAVGCDATLGQDKKPT